HSGRSWTAAARDPGVAEKGSHGDRISGYRTSQRAGRTMQLSNARMDRAWIEAHIPHQGSMCLLDEIESWDARQLRCRSASHRNAAHPLKRHARLGIACGIEYVVQAMAVHGAIAAQSDGPPAKADVG